MIINTEMVELLIEVLEKKQFDEKKVQELLSTKTIDAFIEHDLQLGRKTSIESLKNNIKLAINGSNDEKECYSFQKNKSDIKELKTVLETIKDKQSELDINIKRRLEKYMPIELVNECTYYLYAGGWDCGFMVRSSEVYINIGEMLSYFDEFEDVLVHECYHSRKRNVDINEILTDDLTKDNYLRTIFSYLFEEGIATLTQLEYQKKRENATFITKEEFESRTSMFKGFDKILYQIINGEKSAEEIVQPVIPLTPMYVLGYYLAQQVYKFGGKEALNCWTVEHNHKKCLSMFLEQTALDGGLDRFSKEVEKHLREHCKS